MKSLGIVKTLRHILRRVKYLLLAILNAEFPLKSIYLVIPKFNEELMNSRNSSNRIIFFTWKTHKITRSHFEEISRFVKLNPDYQCFFFDDDLQQSWMHKKYGTSRIYGVYEKCIFGASKSDIFRMLIVNHYGGVFIAINHFLRKSITELIGDSPKFTLSEALLKYDSEFTISDLTRKWQGKTFVFEILVSQRNNPILELAINMVCERYLEVRGKHFEKVDQAIWWFTGPILFSEAIFVFFNSISECESDNFDYIELGKNFNGVLYRSKAAKYRYIFGASYIGYSEAQIARM